MNASILTHSVLPCDGQYLVVYPTPGLPSIPTLATICRTDEQAQAEAARLNANQMLRRAHFELLAKCLDRDARLSCDLGGVQ